MRLPALSSVLGLLFLTVLATGCDSADVESVFDPPGDYPALAIIDGLEADPGRYNVEGYLDPIPCEDDTPSDCLPGTHWLYDSLQEDPAQVALLLTTDRPEVFRERVRYRLSIETGAEPGSTLRSFVIIGAERMD